MSFLILLILAVSALIQVEGTTANGNASVTGTDECGAFRYEPFGDLQRYAGPDQRV